MRRRSAPLIYCKQVQMAKVNLASLITDGYERKARLYPALVVLAPAGITIITIISANLSALESIVALIVGCGGTFLMAQLARDAGKKGESLLFDEWGGLPSVVILRHRDARLDVITKARYHKKLAALVKGTKAPSLEEEQADPSMADQVYTAWSNYLRVSTRDTKKFSMLFQENINYGYRRNVWGMRKVGAFTSAVSCVAAAAWLYYVYLNTGTIDKGIAGSFLFALIFFLLWVFRFSAEWVRVPADAYAARLAEAVDALGSKTSAQKPPAVSSGR